MKTPLKHIFILCFVLLSLTTLNAQNFNSEKNNYLVLSKNIQQLKPILITANALAEEDPKMHGKFYILLCGKTVEDIPDNSEFKTLLKTINSEHTTVFVCGLSLQKFKVSLNNLPQEVEVVDNGILYAFQLKKQGFISLTI